MNPVPDRYHGVWVRTLLETPEGRDTTTWVRWLQTGLWLTPQANPTDGHLTWSTLRKPGPVEMVTQGLSLFSESSASSLRAQGRVTGGVVTLDRPLPWHLDGEPIAARDRAEFRVEPRAFRIQVTDACPW